MFYNKDMIELPLFPLNTVLFPGMPLPLHVFERRYKLMIGRCIAERRPFGVVLIRSGQAEGDALVQPHDIGCTAQITNVQTLENERMLIMTVGKERFRIVSLDRRQPYLVGQVEMIPWQYESPIALNSAAQRLHPLVITYLQKLAQLGQIDFDPSHVSDKPDELTYLAAAFIQIPSEEKQALLEEEKESSVLRGLYSVYNEQVTLMRTMPSHDQGIFSLS